MIGQVSFRIIHHSSHRSHIYIYIYVLTGQSPQILTWVRLRGGTYFSFIWEGGGVGWVLGSFGPLGQLAALASRSVGPLDLS